MGLILTGFIQWYMQGDDIGLLKHLLEINECSLTFNPGPGRIIE